MEQHLQRTKSSFDPYQHLNVALNADGTLTRFVSLPASPVTGENPQNGESVASKEITLDSPKKTSIRIYLPTKIPSNDESIAKLPIIFYFHSSGWILYNIQNKAVHEHCNQLSDQVQAIVISVDYRLAPEDRIPAQYDDAIDSIKWLHNQSLDNQNGERWVRDYGDFSRCYLYGINAGGNIAYNAALRVVDMELEPITIAGLILNQPLFGGNKRTKSEIKLAADPLWPLPVVDLIWELALPKGADRDHRYCNPLNCGPFKDKIKRLRKVLVIGFGGDGLIDRQQALVEMLALEGVQVEGHFDDHGFHGIDMIDSQRAAAILLLIKEFL